MAIRDDEKPGFVFEAEAKAPSPLGWTQRITFHVMPFLKSGYCYTDCFSCVQGTMATGIVHDMLNSQLFDKDESNHVRTFIYKSATLGLECERAGS